MANSHPPSCILLAIDTAFDICSVALLKGNTLDILRSERPRKHADDVLPMIEQLLSNNALQLDNLDTLAMVSGPGSFTGLRIGTAVVQGLAFGADLPVVCVSSLAMLARAARQRIDTDALLLISLHARESEFYFAVYRDDLQQAPVPVIHDTLFTADQILQCLQQLDSEAPAAQSWLLAGGGWHHELLASHDRVGQRQLKVSHDLTIDASVLAAIAAQDFRAGKGLDASQAAPAYLKDDLEYRTV